MLTTANGFGHLAVVGESSDGAFREHQLSIDHHLENPVRTVDQLGRGSELSIQFGRQPGGPWFVISNYTVFDRNVHRASTFCNRI
jgi:hypothetical protein